jgi:hypothetical protein
MKKTAITALIMGVISISVLQAQSDFGPKKHHKRIPIQNNNTQDHSNKNTLAYSLPFIEDFESGTFPPTDWTTFIGTNGVGNTYNWQTSSSGYTGSCAFIYWDDQDGLYSEDWLVSPQITLGENSGLSFYEKQSYTTDYGSTYFIKVSTSSQTNHADFTTIESYTETDFSNGWTNRFVDLSAYDGMDVYIAFVMINDWGDTWFVDNVNVYDDPGSGGTTGGDLIISEVAYPVDSDGEKGRFVELFNSSDQDIDLSNYYLAFFKNTQRINLSGTIPAGQAFVYAPDNNDFYDCYGFNPDQADGGINVSWFNGTDAIYILEDPGNGSYRTKDTYGVKKNDGSGTEWEYSGMHAVRDPSITEYQKNFDIDEWEISTAYYQYRDVTPGNHNDIYYWSGSYNDQWDEYRNWTVNTGIQTIPDAGSNVVIPPGTSNNASLGYYIFPYYFNTLTVKTGASFTLTSYNILKIKDDVTIEAGAHLYLKSDSDGAAAFIPEGNVIGDVDVERWVPSIGGTPSDGEWHYFTPSITDMSSNQFYDQYLMYWNEPTTSWYYITETNYNLIPGVGYGVLLNESYGNTIQMNGQLVTGDVESPVINSTNSSGWQGWNLIGNPYSASLDWEQVADQLHPGIDVGIHYWDGENRQYVFYNNGNGSASQYIPPMQGFFIHSNQNNLQFTIPASARSYEGVDTYYKSGEGKPFELKSKPERIHENRLIVTSVSEFGFTDKAFLEFHEKATEDFDFEFDAEKFNSGNDQIAETYLLFNSEKFSINILPPQMLEGRYDLCINFNENASYTLNFNDLESFDENQPILLHDKYTGEYYDLREYNSINFFNDNNAPENRFEIVFDNWLDAEEINQSNWLVYGYNGKLNIRKSIGESLSQNYNYQIISLEGKLLWEDHFNGNLLNKSFPFSSDIYLVKIIGDDYSSTHKVWLNK